MITIDISNDFDQLSDRFSGINADLMLRDVAISVLGAIHKRVHVEGKASDDSQIGKYSKGYLVVRSGLYKNSNKNNSGFFSKGNKAIFDIKSKKAVKVKKTDESPGSMRINYNRGTDPKVILSLTRDMEKGMTVFRTSNGCGIGYSNPEDFNKAIWNENRYKKPIWKLSSAEEKLAIEVADSYLNNQINA